MKIRELPILARIDPKTQKTHTAAKKCCGWENLPYGVHLYSIHQYNMQAWPSARHVQLPGPQDELHLLTPGGQGRGLGDCRQGELVKSID